MTCIALATAIPAFAVDDDLAPLRAACARAGIEGVPVAWDDATVSWSRFDAVLLRSTWNYTQHRDAFLAWCERTGATTRLFNEAATVRWNTDKRYLADLARAGAPVVASAFLAEGGRAEALPDLAGDGDFVVKPCVGAGSRGARRFTAAQREAAVAHAHALRAAGHAVLVQPYLDAVDRDGETALVFIDGVFSHAIRKGPLLQRGAEATRALFAAEHISARQPSDADLQAARAVLAALPVPRPLYARVDLLPSPQGPQLLELELTEPSLFFAQGADAADRLVAALCARL